MVLRDRNHPSVIIWSLGNEISSDPNHYGPRMYRLVKSLDKTRPITVSFHTEAGQTTNTSATPTPKC